MGTATAYSGVIGYSPSAYGQGLSAGVLVGNAIVGTNGWTIEAYVRYSASGELAAFGWGDRGAWIGVGGGYLRGAFGGTGYNVSSNQWHHIAVTGDGNAAVVWVDGVYIQEIADSSAQPASFYLGGKATAGGVWNGLIDEVRVSAGRRYASYRDFTAPPGPLSVDAATVALWRLDGNGDDATGNTTTTTTTTTPSGSTTSTGTTTTTGGSTGTTATSTGSPSTLTASTGLVPNPDQGWFQYSETHYQPDGSGHTPLKAADLAAARTGTVTVNGVNFTGSSLVFRYFYIEKYQNVATIDADYLAKLDADLAAVRAAGCKIIARFAYVNRQVSDGDATPALVMGHVDQLAPTLNKYADIVHAVQAGFIGAWGEWYYSNNWGDSGNLTAQNLTDRNALIRKLLDKLDPRIFVLIRYLGTRQAFLGTSDPNPGGADSARLGHHNDAFLADDGNYGTYNTFTSLSVAQNRSYLANMPPVPVGGESARYNPPVTEWVNAATELATYRYSYLNPNYYGQVINIWGQTNADTAARSFGHRLRVKTVTLPSSSNAGAQASGTVVFTNDGWQQLLRARAAYLVLDDNAGHVATADLKIDLTKVKPGSDTTFTFTYTAPTAAGTYSAYLLLPDPDPVIAARPEYAIRLANQDAWQAATGRNSLSIATNVIAAASPGGSSGTLRNVVLIKIGDTYRAVKLAA